MPLLLCYSRQCCEFGSAGIKASSIRKAAGCLASHRIGEFTCYLSATSVVCHTSMWKESRHNTTKVLLLVQSNSPFQLSWSMHCQHARLEPDLMHHNTCIVVSGYLLFRSMYHASVRSPDNLPGSNVSPRVPKIDYELFLPRV
jgi:hypothetical protein